MISVEHKGSFRNTINFLDIFSKSRRINSLLNEYGKLGVRALSSNTPIDSGATASMWNYEIHETKNTHQIIWTNDNINDGVPIAILLQYGHATKNGGFVQGIDYINPAMQDVFKSMAEQLWREVVSS